MISRPGRGRRRNTRGSACGGRATAAGAWPTRPRARYSVAADEDQREAADRVDASSSRGRRATRPTSAASGLSDRAHEQQRRPGRCGSSQLPTACARSRRDGAGQQRVRADRQQRMEAQTIVDRGIGLFAVAKCISEYERTPVKLTTRPLQHCLHSCRPGARSRRPAPSSRRSIRHPPTSRKASASTRASSTAARRTRRAWRSKPTSPRSKAARAAFAFASGMAAIDAMLTRLESGDHLVVSDNTYGGTFRLFERCGASSGSTSPTWTRRASS